MSQSILCLDNTARLFRNYPSEGMAGLVDVNLLNPSLARVSLQILVEGVGRQRCPRPPCPVVPCPQRAAASQRAHPVTRGEVVKEGLPHQRLTYRPANVVSTLYPTPDDHVVLLQLDVRAAQANHLLPAHARGDEE